MFGVNGLWHIVTRDGGTSKQGWISYHAMGRHANKVYGLGNWTYQWVEKKGGTSV